MCLTPEPRNFILLRILSFSERLVKVDRFPLRRLCQFRHLLVYTELNSCLMSLYVSAFIVCLCVCPTNVLYSQFCASLSKLHSNCSAIELFH